MEENNLEQLKVRKEELEITLKNLEEIMAIRNNVLYCFEKNVFKKTIGHMFSNLNASSKGSMLNGIYLIKKNYELDLKLFRRGQFYFHKRKRLLIEELNLVEESIIQCNSLETTKQVEVDLEDLSLSA